MRELPEPIVVVAEGEHYTLLSCGNGATWVLRSRDDRASACIDNGDVDAFVKEYASIKQQYPDYTDNQILAQLWDQGGYNWLAVPDQTA